MKISITDISSIFAMIVAVIAFLECKRIARLGRENTKLIMETNEDLNGVANALKELTKLFKGE